MFCMVGITAGFIHIEMDCAYMVVNTQTLSYGTMFSSRVLQIEVTHAEAFTC